MQAPPDSTAANYFVDHSQNCACEAASPCEGGHGCIQCDEMLSYFIAHPQQTRNRLKDPKALAKSPLGYKAVVFDAAFTSGLSVMREALASDAELEKQAGEVTASSKKSDPAEGGIQAILSFPAAAVRSILHENGVSRVFCIYDTPLYLQSPGGEVFSHADIFGTANNFTTLRSIKASLRVKLVDAIEANFQFADVADYRSGLLAPFPSIS